MPATPRDLLKPRQERLAEVMYSNQLQAGQANAQQIIWGLQLEPNSTKKFSVTAGEWSEGGASELVEFKAKTGVTLTVGTTGAGQTCYVLIELNKKEEVFQTASALTTGTPVLPALTAGRIAVGYLALPESFTAGTGTIEASYCIPVKYSAGNESPTSGF